MLSRLKYFLPLLLILNSVYGQVKCLVKGQVTEYKSETALSGVNVVYAELHGVTTNNSGYYSFYTDTGSIKIQFRYIGYQTIIKTLNICCSDSVTLNVNLIPLIEEMEEIVVSASKTEEKKSELTVSIETINSRTISNIFTTHIDDVLIKTPGLEIMDGQASIRGGSGYSYGAGSRVLVLMDGLPMLSSDADNAKWNFLPIEKISKIEIIKGASSVLYGSSALNGIINVRTEKEVKKPFTIITFASGMYDKPVNKNWLWNKSPQFFSNASYLHGFYKNNTSFTISTLLLNDDSYRKYNDKKFARITFGLDHKSKKISKLNYGVNINSMFIQKKDFVLWLNADSGALIQNPENVLQLNGFAITVDPYIKFMKHERYKHELQSRFQTTLNEYPDNIINNSNAYSYYTEYRFWYHLSDLINITTGLSSKYSVIRSNFYRNHDGLNNSGYLQLNLYPIKKLKFIAGMRIEQYNLDRINEPLMPLFRAGINYRLMNYTFLRASFGQGYRYPSIAEKHAFTIVGTVKIFPNPEIEPEKGWSSEFGIKQRFRFSQWFGQIDIAAFYSENKNFIEYIFGIYTFPDADVTDFGLRAMNIENSRIYGVEPEFFLQKKFSKLYLILNGGYTYIEPYEFNNKTLESSSTPLKYRSKHSAKFNIKAQFQKFDLNLSGIYKSKTLRIDNLFLNDLTSDQFLPGFKDYWNKSNKGYTVYDAGISYHFSELVSVSLIVKNILNKEYMGRPGDIRPVRNFSIKGKMVF